MRRIASSNLGHLGLLQAIEQRLAALEDHVQRLLGVIDSGGTRRVHTGNAGRGAPSPRKRAATKTATRSPAKRATTAKRSAAKKTTTAKRATAKRSTAKQATTAKRTTAKRSTAKKATTAKGTAAKRSTAKKAPAAKRTTAKRPSHATGRVGAPFGSAGTR